ncbi:MAG: hypothetical protein IPH57_06290 [Saprospiraceae bacterium]|nr:hypothetical protein [Saprospiraceae bacterium]
MKTITGYFFSVVVIFSLLQFLISCRISHPKDISCPDFKSEMQKPSLSFKNTDFFKFLKSERSKQVHYQKDEFETDKGFKETEMRNVYPTDYLAYKTFEVISEKFVLSQHLSKGTQNVTGVNLRPLNKDKVHNKYKLSSNLLEKPCDTIILNNGVKIAATDILIEYKTIKFKTCTDQSRKGYTIVKELVKKIKYNKGNEQIINDVNYKNYSKKYKKYGVYSLIFALIGAVSFLILLFNLWTLQGGMALFLFLSSLILNTLSFILGIIGLKKLMKIVDNYDQRTMATIGIVISTVPLLLLLISLFFLLTGGF